jgi:hypothetical protein
MSVPAIGVIEGFMIQWSDKKTGAEAPVPYPLSSSLC